MFIFDKKNVLKKLPDRELRLTADGSHTLHLPDWGEHYHSLHGAMAESRHVFIREGFDYALRHVLPPLVEGFPESGMRKLSVLEVGFGTGLNALLTLERALQLEVSVAYTALEPFPLAEQEIMALNIPDKVSDGKLKEAFFQMHAVPDGVGLEILPGFFFTIKRLGIQDVSFPDEFFHLVYHDAFAPQFQPEMWHVKVFRKICPAMVPGGVLTTYSAKGDVKRALRAAGFRLEHPGGPAGKREMTRAQKI